MRIGVFVVSFYEDDTVSDFEYLGGADFFYLNLIILLHVIKMFCGFCLVDEKLEIHDQ